MDCVLEPTKAAVLAEKATREKGQDISNIILDNTLSADGLPGKKFDYMLSNPPFGVEWEEDRT